MGTKIGIYGLKSVTGAKGLRTEFCDAILLTFVECLKLNLFNNICIRYLMK